MLKKHAPRDGLRYRVVRAQRRDGNGGEAEQGRRSEATGAIWRWNFPGKCAEDPQLKSSNKQSA
jgi:hypothetical protein